MATGQCALQLNRNTVKTLLDELRAAKEVIKVWHSIFSEYICSPSAAPAEAWEVYNRKSPEMQKINAAIAKAESLYSAN